MDAFFFQILDESGVKDRNAHVALTILRRKAVELLDLFFETGGERDIFLVGQANKVALALAKFFKQFAHRNISLCVQAQLAFQREPVADAHNAQLKVFGAQLRFAHGELNALRPLDDVSIGVLVQNLEKAQTLEHAELPRVLIFAILFEVGQSFDQCVEVGRFGTQIAGDLNGFVAGAGSNRVKPLARFASEFDFGDRAHKG